MKKPKAITVITPLICFVLLSCSTEKSFSKRKYLGPFKTKKVRLVNSNTTKSGDKVEPYLTAYEENMSDPKFDTLVVNTLEETVLKQQYSGKVVRHTLSHQTTTLNETITSENGCAVIKFKDGTVVQAVIQQVGIRTVTFTRCDLEDSPVYEISKSEIASIIYPNNTVDSFENHRDIDADTRKKVYEKNLLSGFFLLATFLSLIIFPYVSLPLAVLAIIFSSKALKLIRNDPSGSKKGMAFSVFVIAFIGLLALTGTLLLIAFL